MFSWSPLHSAKGTDSNWVVPGSIILLQDVMQTPITICNALFTCLLVFLSVSSIAFKQWAYLFYSLLCAHSLVLYWPVVHDLYIFAEEMNELERV